MIRLNHAEITVPTGFTQRRRADFDAFFLGVLGFKESAFPGIEQTSLVYKTDAEASQFLFIAEHAQPMARTSDDHLGLHVDSAEDVVAMLHSMGVKTGIDLDKLTEASRTAATFVGHELPSKYLKAHVGKQARARRRAEKLGS